MFEGIAKTNTTHTCYNSASYGGKFEGIAKTNTTHTKGHKIKLWEWFEGIAKTNTTHTSPAIQSMKVCLRVLLKQILPTHLSWLKNNLFV